MSRKTYVYDPITKEMVERGSRISDYGVLVVGDLPDFVSPVDGMVVNGRAGLREHNLRNGVTFTEDFKHQWKNQEKTRGNFLDGKVTEQKRKEQIAQAFNRVRDGYKPNRSKETDFGR